MDRVALIHYHELSLKGENKPFFEKTLCANIKRAAGAAFFIKTDIVAGRIVLWFRSGADEAELTRRLKRVFGIANISFAQVLPYDKDRAFAAIVAELKHRSFGTFRVTARRADKNFPLTSQEISNELGALIVQEIGARVSLTHPELTCFVEIVRSLFFFYTTKEQGYGGLPMGTSGRVCALVSGGFDSPVAAWKMMRRGCEVVFVHFHSYPYTSAASRENVHNIVRMLAQWQGGATAYFVPLLGIQQEITAQLSDARQRVVLYRRFMLRIAEAIAKKEQCGALVTGDSLGQVASQTLDNIGVISEAVTAPVFRPLVGENKDDIIALARVIGTHDTSCEPHDDCCSLFMPEHPETRAQLAVIRAMEAQLPVAKLETAALAAADIVHVPVQDERIGVDK